MKSRKGNSGSTSASKRSATNAPVTNTPSKILKMPLPGTLDSNNSASTALDSYIRLLREGTDCDVTFLVGSSQEKIQCHQVFLKARSPVFQVMFSQRWNEGKEIEIPDIDPQTFRAFLEFVYADKFVSTVSDAVKLLYAAHKYQVQLLVNNIEQMVGKEMKLKDSIAVFQAAREIDNKKLMKLAEDMLTKAKSLEALTEDDIIIQMQKQTLTYLLNRDHMKANELDLFNIAIKWGKLQVRQKREDTLNGALVDVIPLIRFPLMSQNVFASVVVPTGILCQDDLIQVLLYFASNEQEQKSLEKNLKFSALPRRAVGPGTSVVVPLYSGAPGIRIRSSSPGVYLKDEISFRPCILGLKPVAITGILLYCPMKSSSKTGSDDDFFSISILESRWYHSDCDYDSDSDIATNDHFANFEMIMKISPLELQWGEEMEVKVKTPIVLHDEYDYLIKIEQISRSKNQYIFRNPGIGGLVTSAEGGVNRISFSLERMRNCPNGIRVIHKIRVAEQNSD